MIELSFDRVPAGRGDLGADHLDDLGSEDGAQFAGFLQTGTVQPAVKETGLPEVAGAGGIDRFDDFRGDPADFSALFQQCPLLAEFDCGNRTGGAELFRRFLRFEIFRPAEFACLIFVGENDVNILIQQRFDVFPENPYDFKRG